MPKSPSLPPMNGLRAFEAAGRHLNFRAAADELGVTQGAIAQHVRGLETALCVRLFERESRGVSFTAVGRGYHKEVSDAFTRLRETTGQLKPSSSKVTVSVTPTFAARWLIPNLPEFSTAHPDVDFRILSTSKVLSFSNDGVDLAVRQGSPPFGAQFDVDLLFRQSIIAVATPELLGGDTLSLGSHNFSKFPLLHDTHNLWPDFLRLIGVEVSPKKPRNLHFNQTSLTIDAALTSQGIALVSRFLVDRDLKNGRLIEVVGDVLKGDNDFYLLAQLEVSRQPVVEIVRQWLMSHSDIQE